MFFNFFFKKLRVLISLITSITYLFILNVSKTHFLLIWKKNYFDQKMSTNGAKTFAMNEASHILGLMDKLLGIDKENFPNEYYSLESELFSHFTNISGLMSALQSINDDDTRKMIEQLEEKKAFLMNIRKKDEKESNEEDINEIDLIEGNNELDDVSSQNLNENFSNQGTEFNKSFYYALCVVGVLVITWLYFSSE